jgi:hypothetical protein
MNQSAICIAWAHRSGTSMLTRLLQTEDVRRELAFRRGNEIHRREELARFQKTIEALREVLAAKSISAAAETSRRNGRVEELLKSKARLDQMLEREIRPRQQRLADIERTHQRIKPGSKKSNDENNQTYARRFLVTLTILPE